MNRLSFQPHISIVLPVRNGAVYLRETLDSLFAQTYPHFSIHVLENCSTDETTAILSAVSDQRLEIIPADQSLSIEDNWNRILDLPLHEWMTILSHDDRWHPDFLSRMVALIAQEPDASLYTAHFNLIDADGKIIRAAKPVPYREDGDRFLERRQLWDADSFGTGYVMRSADYRAVGGIPMIPGLFYADDVLWAKLGNLNAKMCSPENLYDYRYYRTSSARTIDLMGLVHASTQYLDYVATRPYFQDETRWRNACSYVERHLSRNYQRFLVNLVVERNDEQVQQYQQTKANLLDAARQDGRFAVYNSTLRLIEAVQKIPSRPARRLTLWAMEEAAKAVRRFTD